MISIALYSNYYYLCTLNKAFFSIMQNKTDKATLLVSKSLPVINLGIYIQIYT